MSIHIQVQQIKRNFFNNLLATQTVDASTSIHTIINNGFFIQLIPQTNDDLNIKIGKRSGDYSDGWKWVEFPSIVDFVKCFNMSSTVTPSILDGSLPNISTFSKNSYYIDHKKCSRKIHRLNANLNIYDDNGRVLRISSLVLEKRNRDYVITGSISDRDPKTNAIHKHSIQCNLSMLFDALTCDIPVYVESNAYAVNK